MSDEPASDQFIGPPDLHGANMERKPVTPLDLLPLYQTALACSGGLRWLFGGAMPPMSEFQARYRQGILAQFLVAAMTPAVTLGHIMLCNADLHQGHGYLILTMESDELDLALREGGGGSLRPILPLHLASQEDLY